MQYRIHKLLLLHEIIQANKIHNLLFLTVRDAINGGKGSSGRHFASASNLLALTVALARIFALKR